MLLRCQQEPDGKWMVIDSDEPDRALARVDGPFGTYAAALEALTKCRTRLNLPGDPGANPTPVPESYPLDSKFEEALKHRFVHHPPRGNQAYRYACVRNAILDAALACCRQAPWSHETERALDALDQAMFLFNASIARHE